MSKIPWILLCNLLLSHSLEAYKALVIVPVPSKSHSILGDSLVQLIADAGNEVTYLTSFPREKPPARVKEITILEEKDMKLWTSGLNLKDILDGASNMTDFITMLNKLNLQTLQNKELQALMDDPNDKFDVIIAEWMHSDIYAGLAPIFDCPLIWLSTTEHRWNILRLIGDTSNPAYNADVTCAKVPPFTFLQRAMELWIRISNILMEYFYMSALQNEQYENVIAPCIRKRGKAVPDFEEVRFNASLILGNSHISLGSATSLPLNYKPIGGYHISNETKPSTGDLKNLLDNAEHGVIFFSLGSNLKSNTFPDNLKNSLLKMFGGLKHTILWKFEVDIPYKPTNVHVIPWAPQKSILAHPNCILFITHGGILSIIEAIHFGKPIIGIPVFGDQFSNMARAVQKGFAKKVDLSYTMADEIRVAVQDIITNPSYAAKAKEFSFIYFNRPASPAVELVHWVEHVVQTRGALHLRSPALLMPWYQKIYLDLVLLILAIIFGLKMLITQISFQIFRKERNMKIKKH